MKINEIIRRMSFLQLVPLKSDEGTPLANKTKVKIILNLVAYEKAVDDFNITIEKGQLYGSSAQTELERQPCSTC